MALIVKRGEIPRTPHTELYAKPGMLALEEIHGSYGFSGPWTRKLHLRSYPTELVKAAHRAPFQWVPTALQESEILQPYLIQTAKLPIAGDALSARSPLVFGADTVCSLVKPQTGFPVDTFFRNGEKHEIYFVQEGEGVLRSEFGDLPFRPTDYVIVPKGTTYRIDLTTPGAFLLLIESRWPIEWPPHYMNHAGQAHTTSPIVETEITAPELGAPIDQRGEFPIFVKHGGGRVTQLSLGHHPFDLVGWEGALYPFVFNAHDHHDITREIHAEPPHHNTFQSGQIPYNGFSLCTFRTHMEGWHPKDVPAPYAHNNVDSDELMFFSNANYGARKGVIQDGSFTFHPGALPHSPHGQSALKSLAARGQISTRLAVMFDTYFESMQITKLGYELREPDYGVSWNEALWQ